MELFTRLYDGIKESIKTQYKEYLRLMKLNDDMENAMIEGNVIRCVLNDIISSEEYSLSGVACYTQSPEDVLYEIASGQNGNPSVVLARRIMGLHQTVRPEFYKDIISKIKDGLLCT